VTKREAHDIIEKFLTVLDVFHITSPEPNEYNFVDNDTLLEYWYYERLGVVQDDL